MSGIAPLRIDTATPAALAPTQVIPVLGTSPTLTGFNAQAGPAAGLVTLAALATYFGTDIGGPVIIDDAIATPSAFAATKLEMFVSTVSGASLMGYGTTRDVTLFNRAGTAVIGITSNTTGVTMAGALAITGALSGVTTAAISSTATVTSASAVALAVGLAGATNPAFVVDSSTASQAAGLKVTGAATGGTVAIAAIDSGADANVTVNAKGAGTIGIGSVSTGAVTITPATKVVGAFGCNNATPQTPVASGGALAAYGTGAFGFDSDANAHAIYDLLVAVRAALVANGIMS